MLHSLDDNGVLIRKPGPARILAEYFGSIVEAVTARSRDEADWVTAIQCRRRPGRVRCESPIVAGYAEDDPNTIDWQCPACGDNGHISGWQETQWDKRASLVARPPCSTL